MGAKTGLLAFADGDIRSVLANAVCSDRDATEVLVRQVHPGCVIAPAEDDNLIDGVYPPETITHATTLAGVDLFCDRRFMFERPSELPGHLHTAAAGRRIVLVGMHSVVDWLGFAVWEDDKLVRSLSLLPDGGVQENIGEPYEFEQPYWAGEHPVDSSPEPYSLPFHPLELGQQALRAWFGFILEGTRDPGDIDAKAVPLHGFRVT